MGSALGSGGRALAGGAVAAAVASLVLVGTVTGTGPWNFTGLNGDAAGLERYEFVVNLKKVANAAFGLGLTLNGDVGANYQVKSAGVVPQNQFPLGSAGLAANSQLTGRVLLPWPASGSKRQIVADDLVSYDDTPQIFENATQARGFWLNSANAIVSASMFLTGGVVDAGNSIKLYKWVTS